MSWVTINERLLEIEKEGIERNAKEWNDLIEKAKKVAGCLKREKYDTKNIREAERKVKEQEGYESSNAVGVHGHLA